MMTDQEISGNRKKMGRPPGHLIPSKQFFVPWTYEMRSDVERYMQEEGCASFNEAAVELFLLGLSRAKKETKRGKRAEYLPDFCARARRQIRLTEPVLAEFDNWRHENHLALAGRAAMVLVQKGLEQVGRG